VADALVEIRNRCKAGATSQSINKVPHYAHSAHCLFSLRLRLSRLAPKGLPKTKGFCSTSGCWLALSTSRLIFNEFSIAAAPRCSLINFSCSIFSLARAEPRIVSRLEVFRFIFRHFALVFGWRERESGWRSVKKARRMHFTVKCTQN
jgi:hypothetical protein